MLHDLLLALNGITGDIFVPYRRVVKSKGEEHNEHHVNGNDTSSSQLPKYTQGIGLLPTPTSMSTDSGMTVQHGICVSEEFRATAQTPPPGQLTLHPGEMNVLNELCHLGYMYGQFKDFVDDYMNTANTLLFLTNPYVSSSNDKAYSFIPKTGYYAMLRMQSTSDSNSVQNDTPNDSNKETSNIASQESRFPFPHGYYMDALVQGVDELLAGYRELVLTCEASIKQRRPETNGFRTTLTYFSHTFDMYHRLWTTLDQLLGQVFLAFPTWHGTTLLSLVRQVADQSMPDIQSMLMKSIQQKLYQLLYANLCEWMVHGEKYDPFGELFFDMVPTTVATTDDIPLKPSMDILLQDNGDPTTTKIDPRKCTLKLLKEKIPVTEINVEVAESICHIGHCIRTLRLSDHHEELLPARDTRRMMSQFQDMGHVLHVTPMEVVSDTSPTELDANMFLVLTTFFKSISFEHQVERLRADIAQRVWVLIVEKCHVSTYLEAFQRYFLCQRGDFAATLLEGLENIVLPTSAVSSTLNNTDLKHALATAMQLTLDPADSHRLKSNANIGSISASFSLQPVVSTSSTTNPMPSSIAFLPFSVALSFQPPWPLSLLFSSQDMVDYNDIFCFLMSLRKLKNHSERLWGHFPTRQFTHLSPLTKSLIAEAKTESTSKRASVSKVNHSSSTALKNTTTTSKTKRPVGAKVSTTPVPRQTMLDERVDPKQQSILQHAFWGLFRRWRHLILFFLDHYQQYAQLDVIQTLYLPFCKRMGNDRTCHDSVDAISEAISTATLDGDGAKEGGSPNVDTSPSDIEMAPNQNDFDQLCREHRLRLHMTKELLLFSGPDAIPGVQATLQGMMKRIGAFCHLFEASGTDALQTDSMDDLALGHATSPERRTWCHVMAWMKRHQKRCVFVEKERLQTPRPGKAKSVTGRAVSSSQHRATKVTVSDTTLKPPPPETEAVMDKVKEGLDSLHVHLSTHVKAFEADMSFLFRTFSALQSAPGAAAADSTSQPPPPVPSTTAPTAPDRFRQASMARTNVKGSSGKEAYWRRTAMERWLLRFDDNRFFTMTQSHGPV